MPLFTSATAFGEAITAVGALGTASFGVVDATKSVGGGVSSAGLYFLRCLIGKVAPASADVHVPAGSALSNAEIYATVRANWINGMPTADQKSTLKALIKLRLNPSTAPEMASLTGVPTDQLASVAQKLAAGSGAGGDADPATAAQPPPVDPNKLTPVEMDTYGRFDLMLSTSIDRSYEQASQRYRNWAKALAGLIAIALSLIVAAIYNSNTPTLHIYPIAIIIGLLATPLAPVAKDLATALNTAAQAVKSVKG